MKASFVSGFNMRLPYNEQNVGQNQGSGRVKIKRRHMLKKNTLRRGDLVL
jgi:hypothetical protein